MSDQKDKQIKMEELLLIGQAYLQCHFFLIDALKAVDRITGEDTAPLRLELYAIRQRLLDCGAKYEPDSILKEEV